MGTPVNFNGQSYTVPANGERKWGTQTSNLLIAIAGAALSKAGGNFTLTADVNFGATYGLVVKYLKSSSSNIAASGVIRLANTDKVAFRNNANSGDLSLGVSTSDRLQFDSVNIPTISSTDTLTNKTLTSPVITTPTGIVKGDVGLGNVDNTSDANKPVSTAQQAALDLKANTASPTLTGTTTLRGTLLLQNTSGTQPELQLSEDPDNGTNKVVIKAPATLAADYTLTLPTDDGGANQVLQTDGSGGLSWATVASTVTTTRGDLIKRGASADERLAIGASGTFLRSDGTDPNWSTIGATDYPVATSTTRGALPRFVNATTVAHSGSNFTASSGSWTVDSGDQKEFSYWVIGDVMTVTFSLEDTSFSGTPLEAYITIPGSFSVASGVRAVVCIDATVAGSATDVGRARVVTGANQIVLFRRDGSNWSGTNNTNMRGQISFRIA